MVAIQRIIEVRNGIGLLGGYKYPYVGGFEFGFHVAFLEPEYGEIRQWCCEQFGASDLERWFDAKRVFWFSKMEDAMAFKMRWL